MFENYEIIINGDKQFLKHGLCEKFQYTENTYFIPMMLDFKLLLIKKGSFQIRNKK